MPDSPVDIDWTGTTEKMAREIVAKAELFLQAQLEAGIAADQRAMTLVGLFIGTATAAVGGALAVWNSTGDLQLLLAGLASGSLLLIAAAFCMWAGRPCDFYFPGNEPVNWFSCRTDNIVGALGGESENYQLNITDNKNILARNEIALKRGILAAFISPIVAALVWLAAGCIISSSSPAPPSAVSPPVQEQSFSDGT